MKEIGGYFEWELTMGSKCLHPKASLALKSGRSCISFVSQVEQPDKVWLPYYTCDGLIEPLKDLGVATAFYPIDANLEIKGKWPDLLKNERIIYINYFGIKTDFTKELEKHYEHALWIDHTQAFFFKPVDPKAFHFNSARKFFGVPDGAYVYYPSEQEVVLPYEIPRNVDYRIEHLLLRLQGKTQAGYPFFLENEHLCGSETRRISMLSEALLSHINYEQAAHRRIKNYTYLHDTLKDLNQLQAQQLILPENTVPFCYPFLPPHQMDKQYFWERMLYIPIFWKECLDRMPTGFAWEKKLASELLPLPVDHRYNEENMERIVAAINTYEQ